MSGGAFDYAYFRVEEFTEELGQVLADPGRTVSGATYAKLREIEALTRRCANLMREVELLYSGDTDTDSFLERVAAIEKEEEEE